MKKIFLLLSLALTFSCNSNHYDPAKEVVPENMPVPSEAQYNWHEKERIMFVHFGPATWQGHEFDDLSTPLEQINPTKLNTDQWCEAALAWGAKQILFVAKHTGGFCWWQTESTDYSVKNTPYKGGKGDVFKELAASCKKYGLEMGVYVYSGDATWGAGIASGGICKDPSKQAAYNEVYRTQMKEVLSNYGEMSEVWFDGGCRIDLGSLLQKKAPGAAIFGGPYMSIRWPGNEAGIIPYPGWNRVRTDPAKQKGTFRGGAPDGDAWLPFEADTPLYNHAWFWSPENEKKIKSVDQLMEAYYKSAGRGGLLLLNASPDTSGLIRPRDMETYKNFGKEIERRFSHPVAELSYVKGPVQEMKVKKGTTINHVVIMEDYKFGERILEYVVEGKQNGSWIELSRGLAVGRKKIDFFDDVQVSAVRLRVLNQSAEPLIRSFQAFNVTDFKKFNNESFYGGWANVKDEQIKVKGNTLEVDLSKDITAPGDFFLKVSGEGVSVKDMKVYFEGELGSPELYRMVGDEILISRAAMIVEGSSTKIVLDLNKKNMDVPVKVKIRQFV